MIKEKNRKTRAFTIDLCDVDDVRAFDDSIFFEGRGKKVEKTKRRRKSSDTVFFTNTRVKRKVMTS